MMRGMMRGRTVLASAALLAGLLLAQGCGDSTEPVPCLGCPPPPPTNDTPEGAILRFIQLYESEDIVEYEKLFTPDFRFEFSNAADPLLVQKYATGWGRQDEKIAAQNLFQGGVNSDGVPQPEAREIELALMPTAPTGDTTGGKAPNAYASLYAAVQLRFELINTDLVAVGDAPPQFNRFFLVRGDHADTLAADQPADSLHWYIYNWRDESPMIKLLSEPDRHSQTATWGRMKALYR